MQDQKQSSQKIKSAGKVKRLIIFLSVFLVGVLVSGTAWYFVHNPRSEKIANVTQQNDVSEKWVEYKNDEAHLKFGYPESWIPTVDDPQYFDGTKDLAEVAGHLTSPSGKKLEWRYVIWGGKGGDCEPESGDVAFADGNKCSSKHIYSAEVLDLPSNPQSGLLDGARKGLVLTKTKYRASSSKQPPTYQICLDDYNLSSPSVVVGTRMNLLFACEFWSTGFNARFNVANEQDLNSEEAKTAERIMRSFSNF